MLRLLLEDVTLIRADHLALHIGSRVVRIAHCSCRYRSDRGSSGRMNPEVVAAIDRLLDDCPIRRLLRS